MVGSKVLPLEESKLQTALSPISHFTVVIPNTLCLGSVHLWLPGILVHMQETLKKHAHGKGCFNIAVSKLYLHFLYELGFSSMYLSPRKVSLGFQKLIKNLFLKIVLGDTSYFCIHLQNTFIISNQMLSNINGKIIFKISSPKLFFFFSKLYKIKMIYLRNQH